VVGVSALGSALVVGFVVLVGFGPALRLCCCRENSASGGVYPHLYGVNLLPGEVTDFVKL